MIDGVAPVIGDNILIQAPAAPANDNTNNVLRMGVYQFLGAVHTGDELVYQFARQTGFTNTTVVPAATRIAVTAGLVFGGTVLRSVGSWTVDTNSTLFQLETDSLLTVSVVSAAPVEAPGGTWAQPTSNTLQFTLPETASGLTIDGTLPPVGDLAWFTSDDAPITPNNMGPWVYGGFTSLGANIVYSFARAFGLSADDFIRGGQPVFVSAGETQRGTYWVLNKDWQINHAPGGAFLIPMNYIDGPTGRVVLQNAHFDPTYVGGSLAISGSPLGARTYTISAVASETAATLVAAEQPLVNENLGAPTSINITMDGERSTLPVALSPWALFIKVHAAIAVRQGRQQDTSELDGKLERERLRANSMAQTRSEDVTQAPITRQRNRYGGWAR
jgi:hypothetical protein